MPKLITILWRDIPAQVLGRSGRDRIRRELAPRFQQAIDRAAMRAGRGRSDAYLEDWRRQSETVNGDLERCVEARARELEAAFDTARLERMVRGYGRDEDASADA